MKYLNIYMKDFNVDIKSLLVKGGSSSITEARSVWVGPKVQESKRAILPYFAYWH